MYPQYGTRSFSTPVTYALILVNVAVYAALLVGGEGLLVTLAQEGAAVSYGAYWQVFTAMFVHFTPYHLFFNMYGLFYFGRLNESGYTKGQFLAIYFGAGLLGNVASLFLIDPLSPTGGASGAIFGLVGSYVARERRGINMVMAVVYAFLIFVASSLGPGVNIFAHLFGVAAGFGIGMLFTGRGGSGQE